MARPAKSVATKTGSITRREHDIRKSLEDKVRGKSDAIEPRSTLNPRQTEPFYFIRDQLRSANVLGNLDVFVLEQTAICIDRLSSIETMIDLDPSMISNSKLMASRARYASDFFRCCNELCLSPQARAKLSIAGAERAKRDDDPLVEALSGRDD
ncbi:MAG: P27 family phage terminase small subunit [Atopobiaceae bacterium]|jgi:hypothetical protein|nr:P27 family phage terminase small subunit [Atopobiaceae bacterium]